MCFRFPDSDVDVTDNSIERPDGEDRSKGEEMAPTVHMTRITGIKKLSQGQMAPSSVARYGVETPHEEELGELLEQELDGWGIDVFRVNELSCKRPLVAIAYAIFQVSC